MGRAGEVIWSTDSRSAVTSTTGNRLQALAVNNHASERVDVGWGAGQYFTIHTGSCGYYDDCPDYNFFDPQTGDVVGGTLSDWGDLYGPSMVWDGTQFVVVGGYSYLSVGTVDPIEFTGGELVTTGVSSQSSSTQTNALFDGTSVAVVVNAYDSSAGEYRPTFGRWTRDGTEVQAPVTLSKGMRYDAGLGLAYDGSRYWVTYKGADRKANDEYPLYLQSVDSAGTVGAAIELDSDPGYRDAPQVAFDGRNLLVTYTADGNSYLEVRDPSDAAIIQSFNLGEAYNATVDFGYHVGEGAVAYGRSSGSRTGLFMRAIRVK